MDRTTLHEVMSAICSLELIADLCRLGHVFPGNKQELTLRSLHATLAVGAGTHHIRRNLLPHLWTAIR